jgi:hypothetical protein
MTDRDDDRLPRCQHVSPTPRGPERRPRWFVPPLGWPFSFRVVTTTPANRGRLVRLNRYPRQVIGIAFRLPDDATTFRYDRNTGERFGHHRALSIVWAKPARWWRR